MIAEIAPRIQRAAYNLLTCYHGVRIEHFVIVAHLSTIKALEDELRMPTEYRWPNNGETRILGMRYRGDFGLKPTELYLRWEIQA